MAKMMKGKKMMKAKRMKVAKRPMMKTKTTKAKSGRSMKSKSY